MKTQWHFPLINPVKKFTIGHYLDKVSEEVQEVWQEPDDLKRAKEVVDVLHAAETFVRKYFEQNPEYDFEQIKQSTIEKNRDRGYYEQ